ncbi:MAG: TerB family tellurite resistance protein [Dongiaceae bacterium]
MSIWGKILGGAAGFALGGPIGALVGAVAGHAVDALRAAQQPVPAGAGADAPADAAAAEAQDRLGTKRIAFTIAVIVLGAKMAKADGVVSRSEVAAFKQVFRVPPEELRNVGRLFDQARRDAGGFEPYARQVAGMFTPGSPVLEELLDGLFHIAKADGKVGAEELGYLRQVAAIFGFDETAFERLRSGHLGPDEADPYHVLGIDRSMSDAEIKAAYRKLIREMHPDRLIAEGLPQEFLDVATAKMAAVNAAYDRVARDRGLK